MHQCCVNRSAFDRQTIDQLQNLQGCANNGCSDLGITKVPGNLINFETKAAANWKWGKSTEGLPLRLSLYLSLGLTEW